MSDVVWTALIVAGGSVLSTFLLAVTTGRQRRADRREDWRRQDEVAARVAEVAAATVGRLDVIHTLVDGGLTAAKEAELAATVREVASLREIVELHRVAGREPSPGALAAIESAETRRQELQAALDERHQSQELAEQQARTAA